MNELVTNVVLCIRYTEIGKRRKFILKLAKALLAFGAPSHRIESQLAAAATILGVSAGGSSIN